jgi:hypothetical protein
MSKTSAVDASIQAVSALLMGSAGVDETGAGTLTSAAPMMTTANAASAVMRFLLLMGVSFNLLE